MASLWMILWLFQESGADSIFVWWHLLRYGVKVIGDKESYPAENMLALLIAALFLN